MDQQEQTQSQQHEPTQPSQQDISVHEDLVQPNPVTSQEHVQKEQSSQPIIQEPAEKTSSQNIPKKLPSIGQKLIPIIIIALLAILTGIALFLVIQKINTEETPPEPITIVVTPTPTPTPIRNATSVSSSAVYTEFVNSIATLSATLQNYELNDPSLSPPSLTLPLGFPK